MRVVTWITKASLTWDFIIFVIGQVCTLLLFAGVVLLTINDERKGASLIIRLR